MSPKCTRDVLVILRQQPLELSKYTAWRPFNKEEGPLVGRLKAMQHGLGRVHREYR